MVFPMDKAGTRICSSLRLQDRFVFQFAGNLGYAQGIDNLLEAIGLIKMITFISYS